METKRDDKKFSVFLIEFFGTAIITYAFCVTSNIAQYFSALDVTLVMMLLAWNVSGGHFNPTITIGVFVSERKFGAQLVTMLTMIVSQFAGAAFGILLAYLVLINKDYMKY